MSEDPRALLKQLETRARKRFGQHFLTRSDVVSRIVRGARVKPGDRVVEIGPGLGILTRALLAAEAEVTAVELDRDLAAYIRDTLPDVTLIEGDAAKVNWGEVCAGGGFKVVANLPYNVGTTVVMQLLRTSGLFTSITVMLQKEVVDRLMAEPGGKVWGALSVEAQARALPVYVMTVEPGSFHPPPKVRSAVIRFDLYPEVDVGGVDPAHFDRIVRACFSQRRKTLRNSLGALLGKDEAVVALQAAGIDPGLRAEQVGLDGYRRLAATVER